MQGMRMFFGVMAYGMVATWGIAAGSPPDDMKAKELGRFQGTWVVASAERGGQPLPEEEWRAVRAAKLIFKGTRISAVLDDEEEAVGTFDIDAGEYPKHIDTARADKAVVLGIYAFDGDDILRLCGDEGGRKRPAEFSTKGSPSHTLLVLKRERK